jgi:hypothetical protein
MTSKVVIELHPMVYRENNAQQDLQLEKAVAYGLAKSPSDRPFLERDDAPGRGRIDTDIDQGIPDTDFVEVVGT